MTFQELGIEPRLLHALTALKITIPTPIQEKAIPGALEGKDLVGIAQTGTGKTMAFGLPMIQRLMVSTGQGLIVLPTRELALQVDEALRRVGHGFGLRTAQALQCTAGSSFVCLLGFSVFPVFGCYSLPYLRLFLISYLVNIFPFVNQHKDFTENWILIYKTKLAVCLPIEFVL